MIEDWNKAQKYKAPKDKQYGLFKNLSNVMKTVEDFRVLLKNVYNGWE